MVFQRVEPFVVSQTSNANPVRFFTPHRFELSGVSRRGETDVLAEDQKRFFFDQNHMFEVRACGLFSLFLQATAKSPFAAKIMRPRIGKSIAGTVAQGVARGGEIFSGGYFLRYLRKSSTCVSSSKMICSRRRRSATSPEAALRCFLYSRSASSSAARSSSSISSRVWSPGSKI